MHRVEGARSRACIRVWLLRAAHLHEGARASLPACNVNGFLIHKVSHVLPGGSL